jgi:ligand-binding sensor protein
MTTRSRTALRTLASTAVLATAALLAACGDGDREGGQCEPCRGSQPRCDSGLTCKAATVNVTGQTVELCFAANQTRCDGFF